MFKKDKKNSFFSCFYLRKLLDKVCNPTRTPQIGGKKWVQNSPKLANNCLILPTLHKTYLK